MKLTKRFISYPFEINSWDQPFSRQTTVLPQKSDYKMARNQQINCSSEKIDMVYFLTYPNKWWGVVVTVTWLFSLPLRSQAMLFSNSEKDSNFRISNKPNTIDIVSNRKTGLQCSKLQLETIYQLSVCKIMYLQSLCIGDAKSLVDSFGANSSQYKQTFAELTRRFGNRRFFSSAFMKQFEIYQKTLIPGQI